MGKFKHSDHTLGLLYFLFHVMEIFVVYKYSLRGRNFTLKTKTHKDVKSSK